MTPSPGLGVAACTRFAWVAMLALVVAIGPLAAEEPTDSLPRHALEIRALTEPEAVLAELPEAIDIAIKEADARELALLQLARANACRVMADWRCQHEAGAAAAEAAERALDPVLQIRGLIAEARGHIALQDYTRGEQLLGDAQTLLAVAGIVGGCVSGVFVAQRIPRQA